MAVKIKLKRMGKIRAPYYRIIIADARSKRDGRAIEEIGKYHPQQEPSLVEVDSERVQYWLSVGAQPTDPVRNLLKLTGDWQKYKGLPAPPPLKVAGPGPDKHALFEAAAKEVVGDGGAGGAATTQKSKGRKSASKPAKSEAAKAEGDAEQKTDGEA